jgi:hypothetical protein
MKAISLYFIAIGLSPLAFVSSNLLGVDPGKSAGITRQGRGRGQGRPLRTRGGASVRPLVRVKR